MRKIPDDVRAEEGRALARLGDGGWDPLVQAGRRAGRFDDELVDAAAEAVRAWGAPVAWVTAVPSLRSGPLVPDFAARLAAALGLPCAAALERTADGPPQREMANSAQQVANVRGRFARARRAAARPVPARRRRPLQRLDAGDAGGSAAPARRAGGVPARAGDGTRSDPRSPPAARARPARGRRSSGRARSRAARRGGRRAAAAARAAPRRAAAARRACPRRSSPGRRSRPRSGGRRARSASRGSPLLSSSVTQVRVGLAGRQPLGVGVHLAAQDPPQPRPPERLRRDRPEPARRPVRELRATGPRSGARPGPRSRRGRARSPTRRGRAGRARARPRRRASCPRRAGARGRRRRGSARRRRRAPRSRTASPDGNASEPPKPGRSTRHTSRSRASRGTTGSHATPLAPMPASSTSGGPLPSRT